MNPALAAIQSRRAAKDAAGVQSRFISNDNGHGILRTQDCDPIAEYAKAQHNAGMFGSSDVKHAARLPMVIVEAYCNDHGVTFDEFMRDPIHIKRLVKDPKNDAFRIWKGNF